MSAPIIRDATATDAEAISDVLVRSITELCSADHKNEPALLEGWLANKSPQHIRDMINAGAHMRVGVASGEIQSVGCYSSDGQIQLLYVAPEARGKGQSTALLESKEMELQAAGHSGISLVSSRTAESFYLARGWQLDGDRVACYSSDGQPMRKTLTPTKA
ncbi:GNAT family N-acetyltransferase [Cognatishimia maritima]|uniref:Acetyltransferase (GNAT) domain-containing protein n=1 Tax=Cognatishimia maritima TaxID=870908 RepID=A0A1M5S7G5_9RHOB|nr:GNAT family N-acetyltransferase [Cognatishimia maritima]SHH34436.1 Acetyltransferase (GNAT) domain-containing protein [Cognatishimia maritima]